MAYRKIIIDKKEKRDYVPFTILWHPSIGILINIKLLILEVLFSKQILQLIVNTASVPFNQPESENNSRSRANANSWKGDNGLVAKLPKFLPGTILTKLLEKQLIDVLYYKYWECYRFLEKSKSSASSDETNSNCVDINSVNYRVNKDKLDQIVTYSGKLEAIWLTLEIIAASITYLVTHSLEVTILITAILEFIKRFRI